jgi:hypothetical protein
MQERPFALPPRRPRGCPANSVRDRYMKRWEEGKLTEADVLDMADQVRTLVAECTKEHFCDYPTTQRHLR